MSRGQSSVIGVAILVAATVVAVAGMTAAVGTVIEDRATTAAADRTAAAFDEALDPNAAGPGRERIVLAGGRLRTVERTLRVRAAGRTVATYEVGGLRYEARGRSVTYVSGAIVRSTPACATVRGDPPVRAAEGDLFVSVVALGTDPGRVTDAGRVTLRTNASHERRRLDPGEYRIAVETRAPGAWARRFDAAEGTTRTDIDGDGVPSAVVDPAGEGRVRLAIHRLDLEVTAG
ncbi:MAG: hypothetical protein ABEH40_08015 [Haloferacaceae archaeon]